MNLLNLLIVQDNSDFTQEISNQLTEIGYANVTTAKTLKEANQSILQQKPDVVICDVFPQAREKSLEFAKNLLHQKIGVILVTDDQSQEIYEEAKVSLPAPYLVKPFNSASLQAVIEQTLIQIGNKVFIDHTLKQWQQKQLVKDHLFIRHEGAFLKLKLDEIEYVAADGNYCYLYNEGQKIVLKSSLKSLRGIFSEASFLQAHRGLLVNFQKIKEVNFKEGTVQLSEELLPIGNGYRKEIEAWMNRI